MLEPKHPIELLLPNGEEELPPSHPLILALATNKIIRDDLYKICNQDKLYYQSLLIESPFYKSSFLASFNVEDVHYMHYAISILEDAQRKGDRTLIDKLMKKGYKRAFNLIHHTSGHIVSAGSFMLTVSNSFDTDNALPERDIVNYITALHYFAYQANKHVIDVDVLFTMYTTYFYKIDMRKDMDSVIEEFNRDFGHEADELIDKAFPFKITTKSLEDIMEFTTFAEHLKFMEANNDIHFPRELVYAKGKASRYIGALNAVFVRNGFFEAITADYEFTPQDFKQAALTAISCQKYNNIPKEVTPLILYMFFYVNAISREYRKARKGYLENTPEETQALMESFKKQVESDKAEAVAESTKLRKKLDIEKESKQSLKEQVALLQKENARLKQQVAENELNNKELVSLRNFVYDMDYEVNALEVVFFEEKVSYVNEFNLTIVGGHQRWVNNLQKYLPNAKFYLVDEKNVKIQKIKGAKSVLLINTSYLNHTMYRRIMKELVDDNVQLIYMNEAYGVERTIEHIYNSLKETN